MSPWEETAVEGGWWHGAGEEKENWARLLMIRAIISLHLEQARVRVGIVTR